ncbi:hypothetical protein Q75_02620 [Bacillus coahuilensis p1.1.43]|uniref:Potassium channel domain-containing protein n=1 Tax=Bacillus coahuilensis p1.1.43 TaxID=1150625 RepID=A0A147KBQ6_9BACI|nr:potassium channel family protein [Bacillus coahuilensis]KUP08534.1 hypothetical protein Q75_02620 [Bacillus coahuilensis p1.1.43]
MYLLIGALVIFILWKSLKELFRPRDKHSHHISLSHLWYIGTIYINFMLGFCLLYLLFEIRGEHILVENNEIMNGSFPHLFFTCLYFSGVTIFSLGYGDITPVGIGRGIALMESFLGYVIPAAFVVRSFLISETPNS